MSMLCDINRVRGTISGLNKVLDGATNKQKGEGFYSPEIKVKETGPICASSL